MLGEAIREEAELTGGLWDERQELDPAIASVTEKKGRSTPLLDTIQSADSPADRDWHRPSVVISLLGSLLAEGMLRREFGTAGTQFESLDSSRQILKRLHETDWDIAVISRAHLDAAISDEWVPAARQPFRLFDLSRGRYFLRGIDGYESEIEEIYHFGGAQSTACLQEITEAHPALAKARVSVGESQQLARLFQGPLARKAILAKDPIGRFYEVLLPGSETLATISSAEVTYTMLGSKRYLERAGRAGVEQLMSAVATQLDSAVSDSGPIKDALIEAGAFDRLAAYLKPGARASGARS